jgi:sporulation protein YlmC with PRC-barrel domain
MTARRVHLERIIGRIVRDVDGKRVGRLQDVRGELRGEELELVEFHLGGAAILHRIGVPALKLLGIRPLPEPIRIPWDRMDLSDPEHPRFDGSRDELTKRR